MRQWTVFRTIISVKHFEYYGAVSDLCEEYRTYWTRTELAGQIDPLFASANLMIFTPRFSIEIHAPENLLQNYKERVERLSRQHRVVRSCIDAGFLKTFHEGQHFMTKHNDEFWHFAELVTCRECTLSRDENLFEPTCCIWRNSKIGSVLDVTGKYGVDIWIESFNNKLFFLVGQNFS